jgi:mRNA interferase MazF
MMKRGEIWWVDFEPASGSEIRKTRPAVIISNDASNIALSRVVVIPFTSNISRIYPGNVLVNVNGKPGKLMADQIMTADKSRLKNYIGVLSFDDMGKTSETVGTLHETTVVVRLPLC